MKRICILSSVLALITLCAWTASNATTKMQQDQVIPSVAQPGNNVQIKLTLHPKIAEVPQMIYLCGADHEDQFHIYDSIATQPHQYEYLLHGYVPYEEELELTFSRKGPLKLILLAHPDEQLELTLDDGEYRTGVMYKQLGGSHWANDSLAVFWDRLFAHTKRKNILTDSMSIARSSEEELASIRAKFDANERERNEYIRKTALTSPSPRIAHSAAMLLWGAVPKSEQEAIMDSVKRRFPDYYPMHVERYPMTTEQSKRDRLYMHEIRTQRQLMFLEEQRRSGLLRDR